MPELPEVESVRRGLTRARLRAPVERVWRSRFSLRTGEHWARRREQVRRLLGCTPGRIARRGKFLIWTFEDLHAHTSLGLVVHLGMSGVCRVVSVGRPHEEHTHLALCFGDDREFRFIDPRRFGGVHVEPLARVFTWGPLGALGPEPLSRAFTGAWLAEQLRDSDRAVRDTLLDQRVVAGVGNIYVSEILFEARVHPLVAARRLRASAWSRIASATQQVLRRAIGNGGTTLRDYRGVEGEPGRNQTVLSVYGRADQVCVRCGTRLVGYVHQGRRGVMCPREQTRPRSRWVD
jgi:formamidopyrimidine-DNA glycosylase